VSSAAFAHQNNSPGHSVQSYTLGNRGAPFVMRDDPGVDPPKASLMDDPGVDPPKASMMAASGVSPSRRH